MSEVVEDGDVGGTQRVDELLGGLFLVWWVGGWVDGGGGGGLVS